MRKIDKLSWERLQKAVDSLSAVRDRVSGIVARANEELAAQAMQANEIREGVVGILDDIIGEAESYVDERSERWTYSDACSNYMEWLNQIQEVQSVFDDEISFSVGDDIDDMSDLTGALLDDLRQSPEEA